jgi:hypothetical protein
VNWLREEMATHETNADDSLGISYRAGRVHQHLRFNVANPAYATYANLRIYENAFKPILVAMSPAQTYSLLFSLAKSFWRLLSD